MRFKEIRMLRAKHNKLYLFLTSCMLIFGIYPLIPNRIEGLSVILLLAVSLVYFVVDFKRKKFTRELVITSLLYVTFFISFLFSKDKTAGLRLIETMLSLIILPVIFYLFLGKITIDFAKVKNLFFKVFFVSSIVYCFISLFLFSNFSHVKYPEKDANFYRVALLENNIIGEHPIYVSIFLSIAILIGCTLFNKKRIKSWQNAFIFLGQLFLGTILVLLMSKGVILGLFFAVLILFIKIKKVAVKWLLISIVILGSIIVLVPKKNNRFLEVFNISSYQKLDNYNSTSIRVSIYNCAVEVLKDSPFFGYGVGDVQGVLDDCYESRDYGFSRKLYNSHNQFLNLWLCAGAIGFVLFLIWLGHYAIRAIEFRDRFMFAVLVFYGVIFLFENVLSRQSGVIFFAFIINFLLWGNKLSYQNKIEKKNEF